MEHFSTSAAVYKYDREYSELARDRGLTVYEKAKLIGMRAYCISHGARAVSATSDSLLGDLSGLSSLEIAKREFECGVLPLRAVRYFPDGTIQEVYQVRK